MTDATDRIPYEVHARLQDPLNTLARTLAQWGDRDESKAQPHIRRAASKAVTAIDDMLAELHLMRGRLISEIRVADDVSMARAEQLLRDLGEGGSGG